MRLDRDLELLAEHRHEISGARLILASFKDANPDRFITAWVAPWQKTIAAYNLHESIGKAGFLFELEKESEPPVTPALKRDWQQSAFYLWENSTICRHDSDLSPEHMQKVAQHIAQHFNLAAAPKIEPRDHRLRICIAQFDGEQNQIDVRRYRWRLSYVLHEMTHKIDQEINGNRWSDHGPSFVRSLLAVVEEFKYWHDIEELEKSARASGIMIAPATALPNLQRPKV